MDETQDGGAGPEAAPEDTNDATAPGESTAVAETPEAALEAARAEAAQLKDQLLRALAEMENVRRRTQRERDEATKFAVAGFARELLPVADNLRRALDAIPAAALEADESLRTLAAGVELTERQLAAVFERQNIRKIEPLGEKFDSHLHQAMFEVPGTGQPAGTIVQVLQAGYLLHDRLLRPAMVGVAKAEAAPPADAGQGRVDTVA